MSFATPETGLIGVGILFFLLVAGLPIGAALGLVGIGGLTLVLGFEPALIKSSVVLLHATSSYELGTLPLFLLMAHLCFSANASRDLFDAAASMIGHRRGGLASASVGGCAAFGAINGSSLATAATIGMVALPEMKRRGYADSLATGSVAAGGTLGQMIPPSGALIVFGIIAEQSIGTLFTAALIPGITQFLFYLVVVAIVARLRPELAPPTPRVPWPERWAAIRRVADVLALIVLVIGGIAIGWFTPTEAASIGVAGSLTISAFRRRLNWRNLVQSFEETLRTTGMIYIVVIGAILFSVFVSVTGLADALGTLITSAGGGPLITVLLMALLLLLLGSVLDGLALMLLTTPILLPIVMQMGLSPIWFGIFLIRAMEIGFIHPPIGMNLYVIQRISGGVPIGEIFRGVVPFLIADLIHLLLIILFPVIALGLPELLGP